MCGAVERVWLCACVVVDWTMQVRDRRHVLLHASMNGSPPPPLPPHQPILFFFSFVPSYGYAQRKKKTYVYYSGGLGERGEGCVVKIVHHHVCPRVRLLFSYWIFMWRKRPPKVCTLISVYNSRKGSPSSLLPGSLSLLSSRSRRWEKHIERER